MGPFGIINPVDIENPTSVKAYFVTLLELYQSGHEYPCDLDDVWPLFFTRKDTAVRAISLIFTEGKHYRVFHMSPEKLKGRPRRTYWLALEAVEFFIASRLPKVFEIYRQVFHKSVDQAQQHSELLKRIGALESRLDQLLQLQQAAPALPSLTPTIPTMRPDVEVRALVDGYSRSKSISHQEVWRVLYRELFYRYSINVAGYKLGLAESKLQAVQRHGHIDKLLSLAKNLLTV
ncbi:hypothetical protein [Spirosoma panaciterrae]|uniref:hypothetical protein n=1 Tax=Spirosoma panaciterrae TaxID=496058 RepID=UPI00036224C2|nr:hypothetical protein [Spirosoma panaciterrae]